MESGKLIGGSVDSRLPADKMQIPYFMLPHSNVYGPCYIGFSLALWNSCLNLWPGESRRTPATQAGLMQDKSPSLALPPPSLVVRLGPIWRPSRKLQHHQARAWGIPAQLATTRLAPVHNQTASASHPHAPAWSRRPNTARFATHGCRFPVRSPRSLLVALQITNIYSSPLRYSAFLFFPFAIFSFAPCVAGL